MDCTLPVTRYHLIPSTIYYLDDISVVSKGSLTEHTEVFLKVLSRLDDEGFTLKFSKFEFAVKKLEWLGFDLHSKCYSPNFSKIDAIKNVTALRTLKQLFFLLCELLLACEFRESLKLCNFKKFIWNAIQETASCIQENSGSHRRNHRFASL